VPPPPPAPGWDAQQTGWGTGGAYPPQKTNTLATISLIAGIVQFICFYFVGAIVAIVTGHIARSQIKRSGGAEGGSGLALAGLILGYVGLALSVLAGIGIVVFFAFFADDVERAALRSEARDFVARAQEEASALGTDVRDPEVLARAYLRGDDDYGDLTLADGTEVLQADAAAWERNRWRIQLDGDFGAEVCATIPDDLFSDPVVSNGECGP
jgi:hypothetical protein